MTPQERDIISRFIARVGGAGGALQSGSVPQGGVAQGSQTALPPVDPEADRFIGEQFQSHPEARYRITQLAFVQEAALAEAQNRIKQLEYALSQAQQQAQSAPQGGQGKSGGFFGNLFGGGGSSQGQTRPGYAPQPQYAPPPQPSYSSGYQPGMFQQGGSGFLGSALKTAAGVAGGVLAADAISSMFSPHGYGGFGGGGFGGGFGGGGFGGGEVVNETVVNNYGDAAPGGGDPWGGAGTSDSTSWDQGAVPDNGGGGGDWGGGSDPGNAGGDWGGGGGGDGGWDDNSGGGGGDGGW